MECSDNIPILGVLQVIVLFCIGLYIFFEYIYSNMVRTKSVPVRRTATSYSPVMKHRKRDRDTDVPKGQTKRTLDLSPSSSPELLTQPGILSESDEKDAVVNENTLSTKNIDPPVILISSSNGVFDSSPEKEAVIMPPRKSRRLQGESPENKGFSAKYSDWAHDPANKIPIASTYHKPSSYCTPSPRRSPPDCPATPVMPKYAHLLCPDRSIRFPEHPPRPFPPPERRLPVRALDWTGSMVTIDRSAAVDNTSALVLPTDEDLEKPLTESEQEELDKVDREYAPYLIKNQTTIE